ncbi:MAG TPA: tyrosine-type recombinase/integrase [Bryobacteraceae bacterium]|nr:tyrosine-type recombinase/integrase [Bryobacteraceae bacterium]
MGKEVSPVLTLYRRHLASCEHKDKGRQFRRCRACPIWVQGTVEGMPMRKSLDVTSWDRAEEIKREMLFGPFVAVPTDEPTPAGRTLESAIATFMANLEGQNRTADTVRKYRLLFRELEVFASPRRIGDLRDLTFEKLVEFRRAWRGRSAATQNKQLDRLKAFFGMAHSEGWLPQNPTRNMKAASADGAMPDPFSKSEQAQILGRPQVARIRCFVHVMFYSALRISDACMLRPQDLDGTKIRRVNRKNRKTVLIPIPPYLKAELDRLPLNGGFYFLIGESTNLHTQTDAWRTILNDLFKTDIPKFHAHRFRHTAAVNWLTANPPLTIEEVAGLLGNSVKVVEKHYATWSGARQQTVEDKLAKMWEVKPGLTRVK